ncbi:hypothetical protein GOQ29_01595 [Clostridium sp. D2Q-14]|uniref:hypothetical protein n=1 Tax=Anaeromonas gelatinilytica TaxID=2683194 RepID=UPI00193B876A|nr:hypothetical protein [Anaeromonas gelatinilytica]MBS4534306.1 hypothetical protein [Anaeromonas gelatinilytica]
MSKFLGPIHIWLFNKIKTHESLEKNILHSLEKQYGNEIPQTHEYFTNKYDDFIENKPLEELIDTNNIHGWLQNKINIAEGRFADFVTTVLDKFPEESLNIIENEFKKQGTNCGEDAKEKYPVSTAPELFKALNNYILDGMPCDNANNIVLQENDELQWKVINCLHKKYWEAVNGNLDVLYGLRKLWTKNFIENANDSYTYKFNLSNDILEHKIIKNRRNNNV